jgi:hypothetical protein
VSSIRIPIRPPKPCLVDEDIPHADPTFDQSLAEGARGRDSVPSLLRQLHQLGDLPASRVLSIRIPMKVLDQELGQAARSEHAAVSRFVPEFDTQDAKFGECVGQPSLDRFEAEDAGVLLEAK